MDYECFFQFRKFQVADRTRGALLFDDICHLTFHGFWRWLGQKKKKFFKNLGVFCDFGILTPIALIERQIIATFTHRLVTPNGGDCKQENSRKSPEDPGLGKGY